MSKNDNGNGKQSYTSSARERPPHKTPRQARKIVYFYGNDVLWLTRLINAELKVQRSLVKRKPPNTSEYMIAARRAIECEAMLGRLRKGKIEWRDEDQDINRKDEQ